MNKIPVWLRGVLAAFAGGAAGVIEDIITDPLTFDLRAQWPRLLSGALTGGILAVAFYFIRSPRQQTNSNQPNTENPQ